MCWTDPFLFPRHKVLKRSVCFVAEMHKGEVYKSVMMTLLLNVQALQVSLTPGWEEQWARPRKWKKLCQMIGWLERWLLNTCGRTNNQENYFLAQSTDALPDISEECISLNANCEQPVSLKWSYMRFVNKYTTLKSESWQHNRWYIKKIILDIFWP